MKANRKKATTRVIYNPNRKYSLHDTWHSTAEKYISTAIECKIYDLTLSLYDYALTIFLIKPCFSVLYTGIFTRYQTLILSIIKAVTIQVCCVCLCIHGHEPKKDREN